MSDYGIDVASFNTITDWSAVRGAGNSWAWSKATQGSGYTNPLFASQMASGQSAGLAMGAYHFPDPRVSVATQVRHFVTVASARSAFDLGSMLPMLDMENDPADGIEWSSGGANSFIPVFRDALREATGQQLLCVYGPESWWATGFLNPALWADEHVMLCAAQYSGRPGQVDWSHPRLAVHQYTNKAPTPGATGLTDRSVILAPYTLNQLTIGGSESADTATEDDDMLTAIVDLGSGTGASGGPPYTRTAVLRPGTLAVSPATWDEIQAFPADSIRTWGLATDRYNNWIADSDAYKAMVAAQGEPTSVSVTVNDAAGGSTTGQAVPGPQSGTYTYTPAVG